MDHFQSDCIRWPNLCDNATVRISCPGAHRTVSVVRKLLLLTLLLAVVPNVERPVMVHADPLDMNRGIDIPPPVEVPEPAWPRAQREIEGSPLTFRTPTDPAGLRALGRFKFSGGAPGLREIALTFDDGPHPGETPQLLEILAELKVPATFFVVGKMAEQYPDLIKAEVEGGHEMANHTYNHVNLNKLTPVEAATEIKACGNVVEDITGVRPRLFRPPGGDYCDRVVNVAACLGYTTVLWTANSGDYDGASPEALWMKVRTRTGPGGVVLFHDGMPNTLQILPQVVEYYRGLGYQFVTVSKLMADRNRMAAETLAQPKPRRSIKSKAHGRGRMIAHRAGHIGPGGR